MGIVFSATITGFYLKQQMQAKKINHYVVFIVSAFVASLCASTALIFDTTSEIAMATSVLYLVPGVPLINGVIDVVEGYVFNRICPSDRGFFVDCQHRYRTFLHIINGKK